MDALCLLDAGLCAAKHKLMGGRSIEMIGNEFCVMLCDLTTCYSSIDLSYEVFHQLATGNESLFPSRNQSFHEDTRQGKVVGTGYQAIYTRKEWEVVEKGTVKKSEY